MECILMWEAMGWPIESCFDEGAGRLGDYRVGVQD